MAEDRIVTYGNVSYSVDELGYLTFAELWDENFAEGIAPRLGIGDGLDDDHWRVIQYLRDKYMTDDEVPSLVPMFVELGISAGEFRRLFPTGFTRGACKIAGLNFEIISRRNHSLLYENYPYLWDGFPMDPRGFLASFDRWNERFASLVAADLDLPCGLTTAHWKVIHFLRKRYEASGTVPTLQETCRSAALSLKEFHVLFPGGYRWGACRAAGLPCER